MKRIILISMLFFLFACSSKQTEELLILPKPIEIEAIEYPNEFVAKGPTAIKIIGNKLLLFNGNLRKVGNPILYVMNAENGEVIQEWGKYGNGPDECLIFVYWGSDDKQQLFRLFDMDQYVFREYQWKDTPEKIEITLIRTIQSSKYNVNYWHGVGLENGNFVTFVSMGLDRPMALLDSKLDTLCTFGDIPAQGIFTCPYKFYRTYDRHFASNGNKFVAAMAYLGNITFYEQEGEGHVNKIWEKYFEEPIYNLQNDGRLDLSKIKTYFRNVAMSDKYIFVTLGDNQADPETSKISHGYVPQNILMFNYEGDLLYNFHTSDRRIDAFTVSEDSKTIYVVTYEPEVAIIRFDISKYV